VKYQPIFDEIWYNETDANFEDRHLIKM